MTGPPFQSPFTDTLANLARSRSATTSSSVLKYRTVSDCAERQTSHSRSCPNDASCSIRIAGGFHRFHWRAAGLLVSTDEGKLIMIEHNVVPVLYTVGEAAEALRLSRSVIYELIRSGRLRTVKQGRRRLVPVHALEEYVESLGTVR